MLKYVGIAGRVVQCVLSIIVLNYAANEIAAQVYGSAPATPQYADFVGAYGILVAILGVVALFWTRLSLKVILGMDALLAIFMLASGIAWAVGLKGISCSNMDEANANKMITNPLLNLGEDGPFYGVARDANTSLDVLYRLMDNCRKSFVNEIVSFVGFAWTLLLVGLDAVMLRKGTTTHGYA